MRHVIDGIPGNRPRTGRATGRKSRRRPRPGTGPIAAKLFSGTPPCPVGPSEKRSGLLPHLKVDRLQPDPAGNGKDPSKVEKPAGRKIKKEHVISRPPMRHVINGIPGNRPEPATDGRGNRTKKPTVTTPGHASDRGQIFFRDTLGSGRSVGKKIGPTTPPQGR